MKPIDEYVSNKTISSIDEYVSSETISSIDEYLLSKDNPTAISVGVDVKKIKGIDYKGGSFHDDVILASVNELTPLFGKPERGEDKVKYAWFLEWDEIQYCIYDYKEPYFKKDTQIEFHIGTEDERDSGTFMRYLKSCGLNAYHKKYPWQK